MNKTTSSVKRFIISIKIRYAFREVYYPNTSGIVANMSSLDFIDVEKWLRHRHWRSLKEEEFLTASGALLTLTPEAYCFYLPAYMIESMKGRLQNSYADLLYTFTSRDTGEKKKKDFESVSNIMSINQKKSVLSFFGFMSYGDKNSEEYEVLESLKLYWNMVK